MFIDLSCYLTQTCDIHKGTSLTAYGQNTETTTPTSSGVPCFAYFGPALESFSGNQGSPKVFQESWNNWFILLYPDSTIDEQDRVLNITDSSGNFVFAGGRISAIARYNHWEDGAALLRVTIEEV